MSKAKLKNKWKPGSLVMSNYYDGRGDITYGIYLGVEKNRISGIWYHAIYVISEKTTDSFYSNHTHWVEVLK